MYLLQVKTEGWTTDGGTTPLASPDSGYGEPCQNMNGSVIPAQTLSLQNNKVIIS